MRFWRRKRHEHSWVDVSGYGGLGARWCSDCFDVEFWWHGDWVGAGKRAPEEIEDWKAYR